MSSGFKLQKSQNGGLTWNLLNAPIDSIGLFQFVDANTGFINKVYSSGHDLNKTTDGGISWSSYSFNPDYLRYFHFPEPDIGYSLAGIFFESSNIYKTTNTGVNWNFVSKMDFDTISPLNHTFYFVDENNGFIASYLWDPTKLRNYYLNKTSDGGLSWRQVYEELVDIDLSDILTIKFKFINHNTGFVFGFKNRVLKSTDQGESWDIYLNLERPAYDIDFTDNNTGYMVGAGGMILKTTTGGTVSLENISSEIPSGFLLEQNYPNPFNPSTVIRYSLAENGFITLKVYDLTGKIVAVLVNENQKTGSYEVNFDGYNLASGIYFYKLSVNDFTQTKKMVLLK
ncbi:MAG: T9SS type A sorting domain-containing protein [Ignavibacteria bacterium]|nr:T9SS type A sorting domain-containing protein [Ignavibacteria bacterium]